MFKVGKLYLCEQYYLLLYPDPEAVADYERSTAAAAHAAAAADAAYWTRKLGKPVLYAKKNIPLLILNNKEKYVEVLAGDKKGWIIFEGWLGIKEIV